MAVAKPEQVGGTWDYPVWPPTNPSADRLRLVYGSFADELVVLFEEGLGREGYFDFIATPDLDDAAIKIDMASGAVIGVLVYPLEAWAVERHPSWRNTLAPKPPPEIARRIVLDIKELCDRYGLNSASDA
jgi:hypothetical protein